MSSTSGNAGNVYRTDGVDIWGASDVSGEYMVGATAAGDWLEYTVNVAAPGTYTLNLRIAVAANNKKLRVLMNGSDVTGAITLPNTGGWNHLADDQQDGQSQRRTAGAAPAGRYRQLQCELAQPDAVNAADTWSTEGADHPPLLFSDRDETDFRTTGS